MLKKIIEEEVRKILTGVNEESSNNDREKLYIGKKVIVRCRDAGVHYGELVDYNNREVQLRKSRRLWYWFAKEGHTLSAVSIHGIKDSESKITDFVKDILLMDACEIIPCEDKSIESIENAKIYNID